MLSFVDALKRVIANIESTGGEVIERTFPSHRLLQQLRVHAIQCMSNSPSGYHVEDWFSGGYFEEHVRVCVVSLHKLGISDDERLYHLLTKVIDAVVGGRPGIWEDRERFDQQLVRAQEIVWYECGDEQTFLYTVADSRWLITWDYQKSHWKATGLGRLFLDLAPVEAAVFLLSIDTLFATGEDDFHHLSSEVLRRLQSLRPEDEVQFLQRLYDPHSTLLTRLGIFILVKPAAGGEHLDPELDDHVQVTPIGHSVLTAVLSDQNFYRDAALSIARTEEVGGTFSESAAEIGEMVRLVKQSDLVDRVNRTAIDTSLQLYHTRKYLASFKAIYPSIEAVLEAMLTRAGVSEQLDGIVKKAERLGRQGTIPPDVAGVMEIFAKARNKVAHGNISPPDDDVFPLCLLAFRYLRRVLTTYHP
jgi:hypothetical protein